MSAEIPMLYEYDDLGIGTTNATFPYIAAGFIQSDLSTNERTQFRNYLRFFFTN